MIKQKTNKKWLVNMNNEFGQRIRRTFNTKSEAKVFAAEIEGNKYKNKLSNNGMAQVRHSILSGLEDFSTTKQHLSESTKEKIAFVLNQFKLFLTLLGIKFIDEFTPEHATLLFKELTKEKKDPRGNTNRLVKAKSKTVNFFLQIIRSFFKNEIIKGHLDRNPMQHIMNLKVEKNPPEYYTKEELKKFFAQEMEAAYRYAFMGYLLTGMRFSELANLIWSDVDLEKRLIRISSKVGFKTKTHNSQRIIPINEHLHKLLLQMSKEKNIQQFVFASPKGGQLKERTLLHVCKFTAAKAGIKSRAFIHKFRHSYATHLVQSGVPIYSVKELLGHSSIVMTEIYAHNNPELMHREVSVLNKLLE